MSNSPGAAGNIHVPRLMLIKESGKPATLQKWASLDALFQSTKDPTHGPAISPDSSHLGPDAGKKTFRLGKPPLVKQATADGTMSVNWRTKQPINALIESARREKFSSRASTPRSVHTPLSDSSGSLRSLSQSSAVVYRQSLSEVQSGLPNNVSPSDEARRHLSMKSNLHGLSFDTFIPIEDMEDDILGFSADDVLGEGGQGKIVAAMIRNQKVALKISDSDVILHEYQMATRFNHPNVLKPVGFSAIKISNNNERSKSISSRQDSSMSSQITATTTATTARISWVYLAAYELCDNGDIASFILKNPQVQKNLPLMAKVFDQILAALEHIHSRGILHTDIKPENVLLTDSLDVRLADFGMCQSFSDHMIAQGTPSYMSPEIVYAWFTPRNPHRFTAAADVFSFGCLVVNVITNRYPFARITAKLRRGVLIPWDTLEAFFCPSMSRLEDLNSIHPDFAALARLCLCAKVTDRASIQVLRHLLKNRLLRDQN